LLTCWLFGCQSATTANNKHDFYRPSTIDYRLSTIDYRPSTAVTDACEHCPQGAARAVASRGPVPARALLLAGAPRYHEEHDGVAFASPLFSWLEERLAAAGIDPAEVHYATLIGCRPPHQRSLRDSEIAACAPRLDISITAVAPRIIVLCGPDAVAALLPGVSLSSAHGTLTRRGQRRYYPIRHPYAAPHSERYVDEMMDDLRRLRALLDEDWSTEVEDETQGQTYEVMPDVSARQAPSPLAAAVSKSIPASMQPAVDMMGMMDSDPASGVALSTTPVVSTMTAPTETAPTAQGAVSRQQDSADAPMAGDADGAVPAEDDGGTQGEQADEGDGPTQLSLF